ncbi:hypothetical protein FXO38_06406 [Capsicum annuum]|uniref:EndoU domain-containing protein n=1 Tax=Capsicum annuum TaxID=4072 RepID=A0A2G2YF39_CAPAN|nr:hypothetical protein FXO38_06406 [Capsicum annuum]PHT68191.1 hypothetical protein T459_27678 [Capsicum annuum]
MIKTIGPDHSCGNQRNNNNIDSGFLAKKYMEEFRINPSWGVKEFQAHVMRAHNCTITQNQAYMVKRKALDLITGTREEQYDMLWDYCSELRRSNPGTTCILKLDENPKTMVNDKKKGLIPAFDEIMPDVAHRFYVRHLHSNFKTEGFGGQILKDTLWKAARATTEPEFSKCMEEMAKLDPKASEWRWELTRIPCNYAIAAIWVKKDEPKMYVHECYTVKQYLKSYNPSILPIFSIDQWPKIEPPLPPIYKAQSENQLLTIQFEWNDILRSVSSNLIEVSPEFKVAIYTYFVGGEKNHVTIDPYPVTIKCYCLGDNIGSSFPVAKC